MAYLNISSLTLFLTPTSQPLITLTDEVSSLKTSNELSYQSSPTRANDMTLRNDEEAFYVPTIEITLAYLSPENFSLLMQLANSKGFYVSYFDYELGEQVFRAVYMSEKSIEKLHTAANARLDGIVGSTLKMVSRYGYAYTPASDANCTSANKYHMYQLHLHNTSSNYNPTDEEAPNYV